MTTPGYQSEPWDGEHCRDCGRGYGDVYRVDDDLWTELAGPTPKLCPSCLVRRALATVQAQAAEYREGLRVYGHHKDGCQMLGLRECECGYASLLAPRANQ